MVPNQLVPLEKNEKISRLLAVLVTVGAVAAGHETVDQVTVRLPVASWDKMIMNDFPATAVGIVIVALPVNVRFCTVPLVKSTVIAVPVLALYSVST